MKDGAAWILDSVDRFRAAIGGWICYIKDLVGAPQESGVTKRKTKSTKSDTAKAPLRVVEMVSIVHKQSSVSLAQHDLCHLDSERASKLRKRPTRY